MTNSFFRKNPDPDARDPEDTRIIFVRVDPFEDGLRYKILVDLTPFKRPPNLEVILAPQGHLSEPLSRVNIIEAVNHQLTFVMHLRQPYPGPMAVKASLDYRDIGTVDSFESELG